MVKYTLSIRNKNHIFEEYDNLKGVEARKKITELMMEYHNLDFPVKQGYLFNLCNKGKRSSHSLVKYFFSINYNR